MNYYKIKNYWDFDPQNKDYIVAISDNKPQVAKFSKGKSHSIDHYLWYHLKDEQQHNGYVNYYKEKLGIDNEQDALAEIKRFNKIQASEVFKTVDFDKIIKVKGISYGIIPQDDCLDIVMSTSGHIPHVEFFDCGGGGYKWANLDKSSSTLHDDIKSAFIITNTEVKMFIKKYV